MSQRLFSTLFALVVFGLVGGIAAAQHTLPALADLQDNFFTLVTPISLVLFTLYNYLNVIDAKVADGSMKAGDIVAIISSADFWTAMVSVGVGGAQVVGLKVIDQNEQVLLVNMVLLFVNVALRSFTNRTPTSAPTPTKTA